MFKKLNKKGFTLAELLVVVAIIGVLVAISIPIFTSQLEKSREAVDAANIRAAYAEIMAEAITNDAGSATEKNVDLKQTKAGWDTSVDWPKNLTGKNGATFPSYAEGDKEATLTYVPATTGTGAHDARVEVEFKN